MRKPSLIIGLLADTFPAHKPSGGREGFPLIEYELEWLEVNRRITPFEWEICHRILGLAGPEIAVSVVGYEREFLEKLVETLKEQGR